MSGVEMDIATMLADICYSVLNDIQIVELHSTKPEHTLPGLLSQLNTVSI